MAAEFLKGPETKQLKISFRKQTTSSVGRGSYVRSPVNGMVNPLAYLFYPLFQSSHGPGSSLSSQLSPPAIQKKRTLHCGQLFSVCDHFSTSVTLCPRLDKQLGGLTDFVVLKVPNREFSTHTSLKIQWLLGKKTDLFQWQTS